MNLQPSNSFIYNDRRALFAWELSLGGHGQIPLTGAGTYTPSPSCVFYSIDFLTNSVVTTVEFKTGEVDSRGNLQETYKATNSSYNNMSFPAGYTWIAPITSITLSSGTGIAYQYKKFATSDGVNIA